MAEPAATSVETPVHEGATPFDGPALGAYLRAHIDGLGGEAVIVPASGGMSNPTFFLDFPGRRLVLRMKPPVQLSTAAHRIDREYRLLEALAGTGVPVPTPVLYSEDDTIVGTPFYVMDRLEGTVFPQYAMPGIDAERRATSYDSLAATLAAIHLVDWQARGLSDFGRPGSYFERQMAGWNKQWVGFGITDNPDLDRLLAWLRDNMPAEDGCAAISHGDYRPANVMFSADGQISGVFDWELATIGHPLADLGFFLQGWFLAPDENGGIAGLDHQTLGIPSARAFVARYHQAAPSVPELKAFHIAFAMFRASVGLTGVALRAEAGAVPDLAAGREARRFARAYARAGMAAIESWN